MTSFPEPTNLEENVSDLILVIGNRLTKMIYYKQFKIAIGISGPINIILDMIVITTAS